MFRSKVSFPFHKQLDAMDCGPASLKMIAQYYGKSFEFNWIKEQCYLTKQGVSLAGIMEAAEKMGMDTMPLKVSYEQLADKVELPCIVHWNNNHFIVVFKITKNFIHVADPQIGLRKISISDFKSSWENKGDEHGVLLLLETTTRFYEHKNQIETKRDLRFIIQYLKPFKKLIYQLLIGILVSSMIQLTFPFLTKSLVDYGIENRNLSFVYVILLAQLVFFLSAASVEIIRNWIILHITTRVSIKMISDFLSKLLKLPIAYFETKQRGDLMQRIYDHERIESFLSTNTLSVLFGMINIVLFSLILAYFNIQIFLVFLLGTVFYLCWTLYFMNARAGIDIQQFEENSKNQSSLFQMLSSITEIKLNGSEQRRRIEWKTIQYRLFNISAKGLFLQNKQRHGGLIFNEMKNIFLIFLSAKLVIDGSITLGTMIAIQYIIGQLNSPINDLVKFFVEYQDAKLSMKRLTEIHASADERNKESHKQSSIPLTEEVSLKNISFRYGPPGAKTILKNLTMQIPPGKTTAIVGPSGSGKTTLLKLLLRFYPPTEGEILLGNFPLEQYEMEQWRKNIGVVMQDGFIFNDSIENNITESDSKNELNEKRLNEAIKMANIDSLIKELPNGVHTIVGSEGNKLSGGEKQRLLIARAIYKNPKILLFDEATSSLDSSNEKQIMQSLTKFFKGKTVLIIAHRLSTVKNADQIVVLNDGIINEIGNSHQELIDTKGSYYQLVKDQL